MKEKRNENKYFDPQIGKTIFLIALRDIVSIPVSDLCSTYLIDHIEKVIIILYLYSITGIQMFCFWGELARSEI